MKKSAKDASICGIFTCISLVLAFLENLLPPITAYAPGIKIGLPNIITIFLLYRYGLKYTVYVSVARIAVSSIMFGSGISFIYSAAGALLSITVMYILKRLDLFSIPVLSISGAVSHNLAQIFVAAIFMGTEEIIRYFPVLSVTAIISGAFVGITAVLLLKALPNLKFK